MNKLDYAIKLIEILAAAIIQDNTVSPNTKNVAQVVFTTAKQLRKGV